MNLTKLSQLATDVTNLIAGKMAKISGGTTDAIITQNASGEPTDSGVLVSALQATSEKGAASGYCPLGEDSKVPSENLPAATSPEIAFEHVVTSAEIAAKKVVFGSIGTNEEPASADDFLVLYTNGPLTRAVDFVLTPGSGAEFSWDAKGLETHLVEGETIGFVFGY